MGNKAFTLIELIVVMAIVAVLVLLAAPRFLGYTKNANVTAMQQDTKVLTNAVEMYHIDKEEWPIVEGSMPIPIGIGGVGEIYSIDESKLESSIKNIKGDYNDYGISLDGRHAGQVFHVKGIEGKDGVLHLGKDIKYKEQPISFDGVNYESINSVPESPNEWFNYRLASDGKSYEITGFSLAYIKDHLDGEQPSKISIPSSYKSLPVTSIGTNAFNERGLTELVIPNSIKLIKAQAFKSNQLKSVTLTYFLDKVDIWAFWDNELTEVNIPNTYIDMAWGIFNTNKLSDDDAFIYAKKLDGSDDMTKVISYGGYNQSVVIPDNIRTIGREAFKYNELTSLHIPDTVTEIGIEAFNNNMLDDSQDIIYARNSDGTLDYTTIISYGGIRESISVPDGVKTIDTFAFRGGNLNAVIIPDSVETIGSYGFSMNNFTEITLPKHTKYTSWGERQPTFDKKVTIKTR